MIVRESQRYSPRRDPIAIKAILRDGRIEPLEPLPTDWAEGQELVIEEPRGAPTREDLEEWARELEKGAADIPAEEYALLERALEMVSPFYPTGSNARASLIG